MEFTATGKTAGRNVAIRWKNGELIGPQDVIEMITLLDGGFVMEKPIPSDTKLDVKDPRTVYQFLKFYFFDENPKFTGDVPKKEPAGTIY